MCFPLALDARAHLSISDSRFSARAKEEESNVSPNDKVVNRAYDRAPGLRFL